MTYGKYKPVTIAGWVPGPGHRKWTYEAYAALDDGAMYEIIQGHLMTKPMPEIIHQRVSLKALVLLYQQIDAKNRGEVFASPIDVCLTEKNVLQPDVFMLFNEHLDRVQEKRILGAPDLVVEITSPLTWLHDRIGKYNEYESAGVPEYWFIDPAKKTVEIFVLENSKYTSLGIFQDEQIFPSRVIPDITLPVAHFFAQNTASH